MNYFFIILIGICISFFSASAISLAKFISLADEEDMCDTCTNKNCFARKETLFHSNNISEWMLVTYFKTRSVCERVIEVELNHKVMVFVSSLVVYGVVFWSKGICIDTVLYGVASVMLLYLSIVDWKTQYIPFECNVIIFLCGLIRLFADVSNWKEYLIGLIAVSGFLCIVNIIATPILKKKYMDETIDSVIGDGDIKLMAATGLLLGWKLNFLALGFGCIIGSIIHEILMKIKEGERRFAFGPYLSLGVYITMICGEQLVSWYLNNIIGDFPY